MKLFYLGPEGTFTHQAAMTAADQFATLGDFDLIALPDVPAIMQAVQSRQGWGVIAWENNVEGYVVPNLDALIDAPNAAGFARISVDVAFNAFTVRGHSIYDCTGNPVSAHPHGLAQCTRFIAEHHLQPEPASSNAAACRDLKPGRVALGPSICGELYDLDTLAEHVQDFDGAHTEFLVIAPRDVVQELTARAHSNAAGDFATFIATLDAAPWEPRFRTALEEIAGHGDWAKTLAVYPRRERPNPPVDAWMLPEGGVHITNRAPEGWQYTEEARKELLW